MRQWSNVNYLNYLDTRAVYATDSGLTAVTWTLYIRLNLAQAEIVSDLCAILCCHLGCIRSILL